ncbi:MAG: hypothetical protein IJC75_06260 [Oscillospiraceae bacterium]|nr:hypothetical protein [Oscillospiraceae bacterium]
MDIPPAGSCVVVVVSADVVCSVVELPFVPEVPLLPLLWLSVSVSL